MVCWKRLIYSRRLCFIFLLSLSQISSVHTPKKSTLFFASLSLNSWFLNQLSMLLLLSKTSWLFKSSNRLFYLSQMTEFFIQSLFLELSSRLKSCRKQFLSIVHFLWQSFREILNAPISSPICSIANNFLF